jgi:hypothetical protein
MLSRHVPLISSFVLDYCYAMDDTEKSYKESLVGNIEYLGFSL